MAIQTRAPRRHRTQPPAERLSVLQGGRRPRGDDTGRYRLAAVTTAVGLDDAAREAHSPVRYALATAFLALTGTLAALSVVMVSNNLVLIGTAYRTPQVSWLLTGATLAGAMTTIPAGKLGDIHGKKRVLVAQSLLVTGGLVLSAATHSFGWLLVGQVLQGVSMSQQVSYFGLVRDVFPRRWVTGVVGVLVAVFCSAIAAATLLGGWLVEHHSYHALFWVLAAISAVALTGVVCCVPSSPLRSPERLDWNSLGLLAVGLFTVVYGLNEAAVSGRGWGSAWTVGFLVSGAVICAAWGLYERSPEQSTLGIAVLKLREVSRTLAVVLPTGAMLLIAAQVTPLLVRTPPAVGGTTASGQDVVVRIGYGLGMSDVEGGRQELLGVVWAIAVALVGAWFAYRRGARWLLIAGPALFAAGMVVQSRVDGNAAVFEFGYGVVMAGIALIMVAYPLLIIEAVPAHLQGVSMGFVAVFQAIGTSIATQLVTTINDHHTVVLGATTLVTRAGVQQDLWLGVGLGVLAFLIAWTVPHGRTRASGGALPHAAVTHDLRPLPTTPGPSQTVDAS